MRQPRALPPAAPDTSQPYSRLNPAFARRGPLYRLRVGLALMLSVLLAACAAQSPPVPPRIEHPEAVKDLRVEQVGRAFEISFTLPRLTTDGESLTKPVEAEIFRSAASANRKPPFAASGNPWVILSTQQVRQETRGSHLRDRIALSTEEYSALLGSKLRFSVLTLTRAFRRRAIPSPPSNTVDLAVLDTSGPVVRPTLKTTEKALVLSWMPPPATLSGKAISNLSGYRIYSSPSGQPGTFMLIGKSRVPEFFDRDFQFGRRYFFRIRAVFKAGETTAEGQDSETIEAAPEDTFPPAAPQGVSAIETAAGVELVWHPNSEPDLAGYKVYRREDGKPFELLSHELARTPVFQDTTAAPGRAYFYAVSAVDLSGNESPKSEEVRIQKR